MLRCLKRSVEAWDFGPVVSSLYHQFNRFGAGAIAEDAKVRSAGRYCQPHLREPEFAAAFEDARALIKRVWEQYSPYSASRLVALTHSPDAPWSAVLDKGRRAVPIPNEMIKCYFDRQMLKMTEADDATENIGKIKATVPPLTPSEELPSD